MSQKQSYTVLIAHCVLCPLSQACGATDKNTQWARELHHTLIKYDINIIQLPCPEASFQHPCTGYMREPHGYQYYSKLPQFKEHCDALANTIAHQIICMEQAGIKVLCIIGVEHSPTCATSYMRTNHGTVHQRGIFMDILNQMLQTNHIHTTFIGINRRFYHKSIERICNILCSK